MTSFDFEQLRSGRPGCPSDISLDRLQAGELEKVAGEPIEGHIVQCDDCGHRMAARRAGFAAFPEADPRRILARVRSAQPAPERGWLRALLIALTPVTIGALVLVALPRGAHHEDPRDAVTLKGWGLHVYRLAGDHAERALSGDRFAPGDRIRFAVDLPGDGQIAIVGVEASGSLYTAWPQDGRTAAFQKEGRNIELPGAVMLDESRGKEVLYLVYCPASASPPACTSAGPDAQPRCPDACDLSSFVLVKEP